MISCEDSILLISVVRRGRADRVVELAKGAGARGSSVLFGRGTAGNRILRLLCLADTEKELVFTLASADIMPNIIKALREAPDLCKKVPGIGFTINVTTFLHSGPLLAREKKTSCGRLPMDTTTARELICVIVNAGFADDIMHAARAAGAPGGTIIKARGTGTEKDSSFFGITIVPEKEMLMMLANTDISQNILQAVRSCPCLQDPGIGIVFCMEVTDFFPLGQKGNSKF